MIFRATIDNDTVASLPAARFEGRIVIVDSEEQIEAAYRDLSASEIIGFDTETRPSFRAGVSYKVSLLQLSTRERCYLFRLCHIRLDNRILKILGSRRILKVGASVAGDIRALHALRYFKAQRLSNWEAETLTAQQQDYAATDAWVCVRILDELQRHKPEKGELTIMSFAEREEADKGGKTEHKHHRKSRHRNRHRSATHAEQE